MRANFCLRGEMVCYNITAYNEIINFTVSKREVYNSKLRAGIKAERGMVMKSKNLERAVILGLLLSTGVYGTALAVEIPSGWNPEEVEGNKLIINNATDTVRSDYTYKGKGFGEFDAIEIYYTPPKKEKRPLGVHSARYDLENTDIIVHYVNGESIETENNDALHLSNYYPHFNIRSFTADVTTSSSDGINLSHDIASDDGSLEACVVIGNDNEPWGENGNGDLTLTIADGSGIRANASTVNKDIKTSITVKGTTNITIKGSSSSIGVYHPTAVYAGGDSYYDKNYKEGEEIVLIDLIIIKKTAINGSVKGKGIIDLQGQTNLYLEGGGNYGLWSGKNGEINANSLQIISEGNNSYGIAATNGNITWGDHFLGSDDSINTFGSTVTLNGESNVIVMNGSNSYAIYAQGKDINNNSNTVKSGDNGIGNLDVKGDIVATNSGKIDLTVNKVADITGDIEATNSGIINFTLGDNADMIVSEKDNTLINAGGASTLSLAKNGSESKIGNVQAANGGTINLTLGDGAYFAGRVDDYKDADGANGNWNNEEHQTLFDSEFAAGVTKSGTVNMTLNGGVWNLTEQSWVSKVDGKYGLIYLDGDGTGGYAVHIGKLEGDHTFVVNLNPNDYAVSDMLYIYDGSSAGVQNLRINNEAEVLNALKDDGDRIRFATVGKTAGAGAGFGDDYVVRGRGVINSGFSIEYEDYDTTDTEENNKYNGGTEFDETKPGSDYVNGIYEDGQNVYLVRDTSKDAGKSDSGATIINMSRANYKNAIYMDRLNKRMGEMRYVNGEEEQGLWVRLRHDRIGQSGDFRSMNTMYEVGYDVKQPIDNGEHRIGMAIDYMRGSTTYDDIMGKGETKRYGLWLYDTWLGEKGHYTDYIVKWGHLSNDFDIRDKDSLENITGDYSNNVFSVSAEYGKKNDMGNNWYFEPQAQLQLARVTGADYVTTQGSKVNVDGINSLIGRAGFRIGRDMDENSTVYLKADLLHEFMGDQTVTAADATGTLREEFENKGTWYDIGFGFAAKMSKNSYAFMDFEKSFGNDNDETYQINAGMQWTF